MSARESRKKESADGARRAPSLLYTKIAWTSLAVAVVIAAVVLTAAAGRATVVVTLKTDTTSKEVVMRVARREAQGSIQSGGQPMVVGDIVESIGSARATKAVRSTAATPQRARGSVVLINTTARPQPLVATTRLLTPTGVLFRIPRPVTIPARARVTSEAVADLPGSSGNVGPTRWRIPGLSLSLQSLIYAESAAAMTGGMREVRQVDAVDIAEVVAKAEVEAVKKAEAALAAAPNLTRFSRTTTIIRKLNAKAGENVPEIIADVQATVTHVFADPAAASSAIRQFIQQQEVGAGREVLELRGDISSFELGKIFRNEGYAELRGSVTLVTRRGTAGFVEEIRRALLGRQKDDGQAQLLSRQDVAGATVRLSPPWRRRLPDRSDHIRVLIR